jgi:polyferredoxin
MSRWQRVPDADPRTCIRCGQTVYLYRDTKDKYYKTKYAAPGTLGGFRECRSGVITYSTGHLLESPGTVDPQGGW